MLRNDHVRSGFCDENDRLLLSMHAFCILSAWKVENNGLLASVGLAQACPN